MNARGNVKRIPEPELKTPSSWGRRGVDRIAVVTSPYRKLPAGRVPMLGGRKRSAYYPAVPSLRGSRDVVAESRHSLPGYDCIALRAGETRCVAS
jgi:hypothetical protein